MAFPPWVSRLTNLSHLMIALASSVNFFIYYVKYGARWRRPTSGPSVTLANGQGGGGGRHGSPGATAGGADNASSRRMTWRSARRQNEAVGGAEDDV